MTQTPSKFKEKADARIAPRYLVVDDQKSRKTPWDAPSRGKLTHHRRLESEILVQASCRPMLRDNDDAAFPGGLTGVPLIRHRPVPQQLSLSAHFSFVVDPLDVT